VWSFMKLTKAFRIQLGGVGVRRMHSRSCVNEGVGGKPVQITVAPAVRKGARGPSMLHMLFVFPGSVIICGVYKFSDQAEVILQLSVFAIWCKEF